MCQSKDFTAVTCCNDALCMYARPHGSPFYRGNLIIWIFYGQSFSFWILFDFP